MTLNWITYPHGTVKWFLECSQGLLLRQPALVTLFSVALVLSLLLTVKPIRNHTHSWVLGFIMSGLMLATPHYGVGGWLLASMVIILQTSTGKYASNIVLKLSSRSKVFFRFTPLAWIVTPFISIETVNRGLSKITLHSLRPFFTLGVLLTWQWADLLGHYEHIRRDMEQWPIERLDKRITELAHSDPNIRADWHGVRILGDTAIITCEQKPRLSAINLNTGHTTEFPLHPRWGVENVGPLESEVDVRSNIVWTVNGGTHLMESKWSQNTWKRYREVRLPSPLSFSYITRSEDALYITEVQTGDSPGTRKILEVPLPALKPIREIHLTMNDDTAPMPREALWIPTIEKHIYATEFGEFLYTADLDTGEVKPWLQAPTFNGKMIWNGITERIYLAVPNRMQIHVIDPTIPEIEYTIWTQPGIRAIAVDASRKQIVSASVLTGQIWIQDLETGSLIDRMGTVYPLVREMELSEEMGIGVLTTWNAVYKFNYAEPY